MNQRFNALLDPVSRGLSELRFAGRDRGFSYRRKGMRTMGSTVKKVARLTRQGKRGRYLDRDGLYLQVLSATNASYILRYELRRRKREMGLGSTRDFSLEQVRQRARSAHQLLADKIDPLEMRRAEQAKQAALDARAKTFKAANRQRQ
jgi:hypothetical protein